jgi:hypothetical protein
MMETAMSQFLLDVPRASAIWLGLMLLALVAMAGVLLRPGGPLGTVADAAPGGPDPRPVGGSGQRSVAAPRPRAADRRRVRLAVEERELCRYAEEVAVAAERAAVTARRRREEWLTAQDRAEAAWRRLDAADAEVRRLSAAAALPAPRTPRTPSEYADRERYLHRAVMAACVRQQLSVLRLSAALAHRDGWDPRLHPVEQELVLRRVAREELRTAERRAAERERAAWRDTEMALAAASSLRHEAAFAAMRAGQARQRLARVTPGRPVRDGRFRLPTLGLGWRAVRAG